MKNINSLIMRSCAIVISLLILASCVKFPEETYVSPLSVPADFNWKSIKAKPVSVNTIATILNEDDDTVAYFIPPGDYSINVGMNDTLKIIAEDSNPLTKALSGNIKEVIYFPAKGKYSTIMFEDLFPIKGDMDMNDVVFGLNIEYFLDNQARVLGFRMNIQPRAAGSSYQAIGLAATISSPDKKVSIVKEIIHSSDPRLSRFFSVNSTKDGYTPEVGQSKYEVIPITGDFRSNFAQTTQLFINVRNIDQEVKPENFSVTVEFNSEDKMPASNFTFLEELQQGKFNLDIFAVFGQRGREVHFKGQKPTDNFNFQFLLATMTGDFSTVDNWVWAILSDKSIRHQQEFVKIYNAYPNFKTWAEGEISIGSDWHIPSVKDSLYTRLDFSYVN
ncbi:MAG: LruC domain-containing protein [Bacteroidales bacterium]|nr:LruC domain-containing protein [Bacteroidales bacterium]